MFSNKGKKIPQQFNTFLCGKDPQLSLQNQLAREDHGGGGGIALPTSATGMPAVPSFLPPRVGPPSQVPAEALCKQWI